jgi:UDP-glucose 4-epimerase
MTLAWVIGGGGLLGTALRRTLSAGDTRLFSPQGRFAWGDDQAMQRQFALAVQDFGAQAGAHERWEIYWAAGLGTMGADRTQMASETQALLLLLGLLAANAALHARPGAMAYSGSASAMWAACGADVIDEDTPPATLQPYGLEKLRQEDALRQFASAWPHLPVLLARFSSLYGTNQGLNKRQGLMSQVARNVVRRQPVQIFVPFDTIRATSTPTTPLRTSPSRCGRCPRMQARRCASWRRSSPPPSPRSSRPSAGWPATTRASSPAAAARQRSTRVASSSAPCSRAPPWHRCAAA